MKPAYLAFAVTWLSIGVPAGAQDNPPPVISIILTPDTATSVPAHIDYELTGGDPNGTIAYVYWSFGEGGHRLDASGQYTFVSPGTYTVTVTAVDDQGATATDSATVTVSDPDYPTVRIDTPAADPTTVSQNTITVTGTSTGASDIRWSTDRGEVGAATGTTGFSADVPLHPGRNRLLINAYTATGEMTLVTREIHYHPPDPLTITNIMPQSPGAERWEPYAVEFDIESTRATEFEWPYEASTPPGVAPGVGITVNGEFSDDNFATTLIQPAFYYQPYVYEVRNSRDWLRPQGQPRWVIRFAPPRAGDWQYRITATDAGGTAMSATYDLAVVEPTDPDNHGFVRVNPDDTRYFRFDDDTHFTGVGHNENYTDVKQFLYKLDERLARVGDDSANFFRTWTTGSCIFGSAHPPLLSATLPYVGYLPAEGLTAQQAYADGDVSVRLDASNPCMFYGWLGGDTALDPGRTYRIRARVKVVEVSGPAQAGYEYGFTVKRIGWPDPPANFFPNNTPIVSHRSGSHDWTVLEGEFTSSSSYLGNLGLILENTTGGQAYIDEISIREVLSGDLLGPELNRRSRMNYHKYFCDLTSWQHDYMLERARELNLYFRIAITERNDIVLKRLGHAGFMEPDGSPKNFNAPPGTACWTYQTYWWRYVTARWGAYRNLHSWELANEQDPWDSRGYVHTQNMAEWFHANDPMRHDAVTSFWSSFPDTQFWANPAYPDVAHADIHQYLYDGTPENLDTALGHWTLGRNLKARHIGKPIVRGETGVLAPEGHGGGEHPDIKLDVEGVYLHNLTWAMLDHNGMYELYWFAANIRGEGVGHGDLYDVFRPFRIFMTGIPLGNGHYVNADASSSDPAARVVGQVDPVNHKGHLWIQHADHTWKNVVDGLDITPIDATIEVPALASPAHYDITWFDTISGNVTSQERIGVASDGTLRLSFEGLATDIAVNFELTTWLARTDFDLDNDVDLDDFGHLQACFTGPGVAQIDPACQDARLDDDTDVDQSELAIFLDCMGGANTPADPLCSGN